jgi:hypothetical protein
LLHGGRFLGDHVGIRFDSIHLTHVEQAAPDDLPIAARVVIECVELRRKGEESTERAGVRAIGALHFSGQVEAFSLGILDKALDVAIFHTPEGMTVGYVLRVNATGRREQ